MIQNYTIISKNTLHTHDIFLCFTNAIKFLLCFTNSILKVSYTTSLLQRKRDVLVGPLHFTDEEMRSKEVKRSPQNHQQVVCRAGTGMYPLISIAVSSAFSSRDFTRGNRAKPGLEGLAKVSMDL